MRRAIRFKLIATYVGLAAVTLALVLVVVLAVLQRRYLETYAYVVSTQARLIATMLTEGAGAIPPDQQEALAQQFRWRPDVVIALLDAHGRGPTVPPGAPPPPEVGQALARPDQPAYAVRDDPRTGQRRVFAAAAIGPRARPTGVVHVSAPAVWVQRQLRRLLPAFGGALLLGLGAAWVVGARLARSLTDPIERLTRAAERLREGDLDAQVAIDSDDEIGRLGRAFSAMAARLRETIEGLRAERTTLAAILTSMQDGVIATDRQGRLLLVNRAAEELLGLPSGAAVGAAAADLLPAPLVAMLAEAATAARVGATELQREDRVMEVHCAPIWRGDGGTGEAASGSPGAGTAGGRTGAEAATAEAVTGAVAVVRDVTELRRSERLRRELTANVSHELRTPLTSIKGFAETLLAGAMRDEATARRFLEIIDAEANRLVKLVDDLMDLSRLEARGAALELAPVDLPALVEETVTRLRPLAGSRRLEVHPGTGSVTVLGDRDRLAQVLTNLIDNAIKFTPEPGRVEVAWRRQDGTVVLTVRDTGQGIPPADLPHIFERFYKANRSRSAATGSGLGLAIARHIVEAHGGRITVQSREGAGTTFTVVLPRVPEEERAAAEEQRTRPT
ncbi:MAG: ATP-binding protein [Armatimonadota bacterium]|nr:ATP-binding protein [Armatimonadota bacterium]MDR7447850.1 ATP-binding protein [Armatimonadota bacterium]MDR7459868.1 ATP-binding protein [Armatimonadota bacterium]MDR7479801.1 ATP-binding protein [Armatimonadota bacterium]MDR7487536.1 ATP-binding protein [Armatimonadota bacterium]